MGGEAHLLHERLHHRLELVLGYALERGEDTEQLDARELLEEGVELSSTEKMAPRSVCEGLGVECRR